MQSFGIDNFSEQHAAPFIRLDLSAAAGQAHLWDLLGEKNLCFVHLSPPNTTAGRARARQWPGAPPVVRSCERPDGLSGLSSDLRDRVQRENNIFNLCAEVCRFCHDRRILFSCEAPVNSFMWALPAWVNFVETVPHLCTHVDQCMFGHASFRSSLFIHNIAAFHPLELRCDRSHLHEPARGTSSLAYPWTLARALAHAVREQMLGWGIKLPADRLEFLDDMIKACRAYAGVQVRKRLPPLVPEFQFVAKVRGLFPEFCRSFLQPGSRLPASMPLPSSCVCHPQLERVPAGSKVLRAVFRGGMTGASSDLMLSDRSAMSGSSDLKLSDYAVMSGSSGLKLSDYAAMSGSSRHASVVSNDPCAETAETTPGGAETAVSSNFVPSPVPPTDSKVHPAEEFAEGVLHSGASVSKIDVLRIFDLLPDTDMLRGDRTRARDSDSKCFITGAYIFSSMAGLRKTTSDFPFATQCLVRYIRQLNPTHTFGTVAIFRNLQAKPHADAHNQEGSMNLIAPLSTFEGGHLWVADGLGLVSRHIEGSDRLGSLLDVSAGPCRFDPRNLHATDPWVGRRDVIVGFTPRDLHCLSKEDRSRLTDLGFLLECPALGVPTDTPAVEHMSTEGEVDFGVYHSPEDFLQKVLSAKHPCHFDNLLPEDLRHAIRTNVEMSDEALARMRTERLREWIAWAQELQVHEDLLKHKLPLHRKQVLSKKRLCLFRRALQQAGHGDHNLVDDITKGFNLTGRLPEAGVLKPDFRPAVQPVPLLREGARRAREAILAECTSSGSAEVDRGVEEATLKELDLGFIEGPFEPSGLPEGATLTRRFGVVQGETEEGAPKVRPIDDYKRSMVNASVTQTEKVVVHNLDVVAAMASAWMREHLRAGHAAETVAKCWDLKAAYKQLALDDSSFELDSFFVIYSPTQGKPLVFKQRVLPFGSIASVTGFIRSGLGLWSVSVKLLALVWSMYFDDFLHLTRASSARHAELVIGFSLGFLVGKFLPISFAPTTPAARF